MSPIYANNSNAREKIEIIISNHIPSNSVLYTVFIDIKNKPRSKFFNIYKNMVNDKSLLFTSQIDKTSTLHSDSFKVLKKEFNGKIIVVLLDKDKNTISISNQTYNFPNRDKSWKQIAVELLPQVVTIIGVLLGFLAGTILETIKNYFKDSKQTKTIINNKILELFDSISDLIDRWNIDRTEEEIIPKSFEKQLIRHLRYRDTKISSMFKSDDELEHIFNLWRNNRNDDDQKKRLSEIKDSLNKYLKTKKPIRVIGGNI